MARRVPARELSNEFAAARLINDKVVRRVMLQVSFLWAECNQVLAVRCEDERGQRKGVTNLWQRVPGFARTERANFYPASARLMLGGGERCPVR
jgi:hypothetical protein